MDQGVRYEIFTDCYTVPQSAMFVTSAKTVTIEYIYIVRTALVLVAVVQTSIMQLDSSTLVMK